MPLVSAAMRVGLTARKDIKLPLLLLTVRRSPCGLRGGNSLRDERALGDWRSGVARVRRVGWRLKKKPHHPTVESRWLLGKLGRTSFPLSGVTFSTDARDPRLGASTEPAVE